MNALLERIEELERTMDRTVSQLNALVANQNASSHGFGQQSIALQGIPPPPPPPPPVSITGPTKLVIQKSVKSQEALNKSKEADTMDQVLCELSSLRRKVGTLMSSPRSTYLSKAAANRAYPNNPFIQESNTRESTLRPTSKLNQVINAS